MLKLAVAVILCACAYAGPKDDPAWLSFKQQHGKKYGSPAEEQNRYSQFMKNKQKMDQHNQEFNQGTHTHSKGINQFSDLSPEEMNSYKGLLPLTPEEQQKKSQVPPVQPDPTLPDSINWVEKGAVTPVQQQGKCNSCWTFASAAALESRIFLKTGRLTKLSEQNILDCSTPEPTCVHGGHISDAYKYVAKNNGVDTEESYPYNKPPRTSGECKYTVEGKGGTATGYKHVHDSEEALKQALAHGPVSVAVDATTWKDYKTGVYHCPSSSEKTDHAVLAVGYGTDPKHGDYWLVKNSWATTWGEEGYIKIVRNRGNKLNNCLITHNVNFPTFSGPGDESAAATEGPLLGDDDSAETTADPATTDAEATPPPDGEDSHRSCCWWAKFGFCDRKPFYMRPNCQKSCGTSGCKVDNALDCAVTVNLEGCPYIDVPFPPRLKDHLKKRTTHPVGPDKPGCDNSHKFCRFWAYTGECQKNRSWMGANCKAACSTCDA